MKGNKKSKKKNTWQAKSVYKEKNKCFNKSKFFQLIRVTNGSSCAFGIVISIMSISAKLAYFFILYEKVPGLSTTFYEILTSLIFDTKYFLT